MSDTPRPQPPGPPSLPPLLWPADLRAVGTDIAWLWQGFLAPGAVPLLTSQWKAGKTTLTAVLLARLKRGGRLAGLPLARGQAVVVSEEGPAHWQRRSRKLNFGRHVCWLCRPFAAKPRPDEWLALIDRLAGLRDEYGLTLAALDPLSYFLPGHGENDAAAMLESSSELTARSAVFLEKTGVVLSEIVRQSACTRCRASIFRRKTGHRPAKQVPSAFMTESD